MFLKQIGMSLVEKDKVGFYPLERALSSHADDCVRYLA